MITFQEFTRTYRDKLKSDGSPYVFPQDISLVMAQTGLERQQIMDWLLVWDEIQTAWAKNLNRMPTREEIVHEYEVDHGIVSSSTPAPPAVVPIPERNESNSVATPWGRALRATKPTGIVVVAQMTVDQLEELIVHAVSQVLELQPAPKQDDAAAAMRVKLQAAIEALK